MALWRAVSFHGTIPIALGVVAMPGRCVLTCMTQMCLCQELCSTGSPWFAHRLSYTLEV